MRSFVALLVAAFMIALSFVPTHSIYFDYSTSGECSHCGRFNYSTVQREIYVYSYDDDRHGFEKVMDMLCVHCNGRSYESNRRLEKHKFYSIDLGCSDGRHGFIIKCRVCRDISSYKYLIECNGQPHVRMTKAAIDLILENNPWQDPELKD